RTTPERGIFSFLHGKKMFLLFVILVAGSLVEGLPVKRERYQTIKCKPDDNSIVCIQEQPIFDQAQQSNKIDSMVKKVPSYPVPVPFSEEDSSSGNGVFSGEEPGSATSYEPNSNEIKDYKVKYNLFEDNLIV
ncbi:serglycin, partial [Mixophyes fleayi]|uniref:serglycin n=1 Tax=Mixophyes fleayi TaxID=3061075 RepID=UPI003F4DF064